jgi:hypothetical protein
MREQLLHYNEREQLLHKAHSLHHVYEYQPLPAGAWCSSYMSASRCQGRLRSGEQGGCRACVVFIVYECQPLPGQTAVRCAGGLQGVCGVHRI